MTQNIIKFDPSKRKKSGPKPLENRLKLQPDLRIWRILWVALILLAVGLLFFWGSDDNFDWSSPPNNAVTVSARDVRIVDGDTVEVAGEKLRLKGWDTPEKFGNEKCAKEKMLGEGKPVCDDDARTVSGVFVCALRHRRIRQDTFPLVSGWCRLWQTTPGRWIGETLELRPRSETTLVLS